MSSAFEHRDLKQAMQKAKPAGKRRATKELTYKIALILEQFHSGSRETLRNYTFIRRLALAIVFARLIQSMSKFGTFPYRYDLTVFDPTQKPSIDMML